MLRIEKLLELSDEQQSEEDEPTLSLSTADLMDEPRSTTVCLKLRRRSTSECVNEVERLSRRRAKRENGSHRYEATQSVERTRERSPVFFLEPDDWIRTEGSSPLPFQQTSSKLLHPSLNVLSESAESLSASDNHLSASDNHLSPEDKELASQDKEPANQKTKSLTNHDTHIKPIVRKLSAPEKTGPAVPPPSGRQFQRSQSEAPPSSAGVRSRSAGGGEERQRKVAIPILCRRGAMMVGRGGKRGFCFPNPA